MKANVTNSEVPHCLAPQCNGLVKPDIVFFGEQLPGNFHRNREAPCRADLCIIMGTSLTVQPFASLPGLCQENVPRLLINSERVGDLGCRADDVLLLGDCDDGVRKLASALGWEDELEAAWNRTKPNLDNIKSPTINETRQDKALEDEVALLTDEIDKSLKLASDHTSRVPDHSSKKDGRTSRSEVDASGAQPSSKSVVTERKPTKTAGHGTSDAEKPSS